MDNKYNNSKRFYDETRYTRSITKKVEDLALDKKKKKRHTLRVGLGIKFN